MKVLAFAASNSSKSINKQLVTYAVSLLDGCDVEILDLNDYEMPIYSMDRELALGQQELAQAFLSKIGDSDAVVISFAEHNGSYTAAYKNLFDWCSRINSKVYQGKPMVLLSTSPGPGGAGSVLGAATNSMKFFDGQVRATLSVPRFNDNFDTENARLANAELDEALHQVMGSLQSSDE